MNAYDFFPHTRVWFFDSTGEAYDACQCHDEIRTGDTLVVPTERVVGLAWAWPVALTPTVGKFHTLMPDTTLEDLDDHDKKRVFTDDQIMIARLIAKGYET